MEKLITKIAVGFILFCWVLSAEVEATEVEVDQSTIASLVQVNGTWKIIDRYLEWNDPTGDVIGRGSFENSQTKTGWMFLELETNQLAPDELQAKSAGILEGYFTRTYIVEFYKEFFANDICATDLPACTWIKERFVENLDWVKTEIREKADSDSYWHLINLAYQQIQGISEGLLLKEEELSLEKDEQMDYETGVLIMNYVPDFWDLKDQYVLLHNNSEKVAKRSTPSCSVMIKYLPDKNEILFGHNSWFEYRAMEYRLLKHYDLNFHMMPSTKEIIPGKTMSMSSYAGVIMSLDDFYLVSSGLAAMETSLFVYDKQLLKEAKTTDIVYEPIRVITALRLARNGPEWADLFTKHNSGTYNNQWMVLNLNLVNKTSESGMLPDGFLTVLEQLPGHFVVQDQTELLRTRTYWASYNRAFYPEIFEMSGAKQLVEEYGDWFSYDKTPRAKIFARDHVTVHDMDSLMSLQRYNDFEHDPFAQVQGCSPLRTSAGSIASRLDLGAPESNCSFSKHDYMIGHWGYGALDAKIASSSSFPSLELTAVAGPTHGPIHAPFDWRTTNLNSIPKFRPIEKFDFEPITKHWSTKKPDRKIKV